MLMPLKRYAEFSGRSGRKEYWMFTLGQVLIFAAWVVLAIAAYKTSGSDTTDYMVIVLGLIAAVMVIPTLAVQVRRFHDQDRSGWYCLLNLVPYLGPMLLFGCMALKGTPGENRFGRNPYDNEHLTEVFS